MGGVDLHTAIMGVAWSLGGVMVLIVLARFYVRIWITDYLGADDWFMLLAAALEILHQAFIVVAWRYGDGRPDTELTRDQLSHVLEWVFISVTPGVLVSITARISIIILLTRLFGRKKWLRLFLLISGVTQAVVTAVFLVVLWLQIRPIQAVWDFQMPSHRWDSNVELKVNYLMQSLFTFSDLTYVLFPCIVIYGLQITPRQKIGLCAIMAFGLFTMAASIMKTIEAGTPSRAATRVQDSAKIVIWALVEQNLVIIMGCIPALGPLTATASASQIHRFASSLANTFSLRRLKRRIKSIDGGGGGGGGGGENRPTSTSSRSTVGEGDVGRNDRAYAPRPHGQVHVVSNDKVILEHNEHWIWEVDDDVVGRPGHGREKEK